MGTWCGREVPWPWPHLVLASSHPTRKVPRATLRATGTRGSVPLCSHPQGEEPGGSHQTGNSQPLPSLAQRDSPKGPSTATGVPTVTAPGPVLAAGSQTGGQSPPAGLAAGKARPSPGGQSWGDGVFPTPSGQLCRSAKCPLGHRRESHLPVTVGQGRVEVPPLSAGSLAGRRNCKGLCFPTMLLSLAQTTAL